MISRRLITAIALIAGFSAYMTFLKNEQGFIIPLVIAILVGVVVYIFQYQLDWWWSKGRTLRIGKVMQNMLLQTNAFYRNLNEVDRAKFETRMERWIRSKEFSGKGLDDLPDDLKYVVATYPVMLTFHQEEFIYEGLDKIVFYPHPFLSPNENERIHVLEVEKEDGVFIFAAKHLMTGHAEANRYYNIGLHAFVDATHHLYPLPFQFSDPSVWQKLEKVSTISKQKLEEYLGITLNDPLPVIVHHFFTFEESFKLVFPNWYEQLSAHFIRGEHSEVQKINN